MKDSRCTVCKYQGDHDPKELHQDVIYRGNGNRYQLNLCYMHSWELFRGGQHKFLRLYQQNFQAVFGTESEPELMDHMKEVPLPGWAA